ncbi:proteasome subunit beta [Spongiactinospora gelatinilytica]|uniref:Proteasome subunit beta n=1 Tax=Spongiactinospora gelatinilytica TaxID=2666298 RepID=A0A2W2FVK1_9ACTN|nr:proteasome subunit beta [Spongiactinospora gelatinilytica]PZG29190.1 proteasome subunit beta [Spongiactinospora gelatinilytica]
MRDDSQPFQGLFSPAGTSSFTDFVASAVPALVPWERRPPAVSVADQIPHSTTIIAATCAGGVVMAADRRGTSGNMIVERNAEKVYRVDDFSCVGAAGAGSIGMELTRLYGVELEHYEKAEGRALSVEGKANRLAAMIRGNLGMAMQGMVVVPILAAYDDERGTGRIFTYDVAGGPYESWQFHAIGSGSIFARGALKKLYREDAAPEEAVLTCVQALYDAAEDDAATGGPDVARRTYPRIAVITAEGFHQLSDDEVEVHVRAMLDARMTRPDGPAASLT